MTLDVGAAERIANPLSLPDYRRYWLSRVATTIATQIQVVAVGWQMYEITGSALALGLVGLFQFAPALLLIMVVGPIVDRYDRRRILMLCRLVQGGAALSLAVASLTGLLDQSLLYGLVFVLGIVGAFGGIDARLVDPDGLGPRARRDRERAALHRPLQHWLA